MDHSGMDHGDMGHGGMDHGDMDHGAMCSMNMLFTWDTDNLCIVFRGWRISSTASLIWSLLAIVLLTAGYEFVREMARLYESREQKETEALPTTSYPNESNPLINPSEDTSTSTTNRSTTCSEIPSSLLTPSGRPSTATHSQQQQRKLVKALFYAVQVFYSFFIMLLFMTYNGWIMLSVAVGAFVGYLLFSGGSVGGASAAKSAACH